MQSLRSALIIGTYQFNEGISSLVHLSRFNEVVRVRKMKVLFLVEDMVVM